MTNNDQQLVGGVRARINFAADRQDGGMFSNFDPSMANQNLENREIEIHDARKLTSPPRIAAEGFELHTLAFADMDILDEAWVADVYVPRVQAFIKDMTGAAEIVAFQGSRALIRDTAKFTPGRSIAAEFVHIDQTRTSPLPMLEKLCDPATIARYPHAQIFNVWRAQTPPPQNVPLAVSDQRTIDPVDQVEAKAVEPGHEGYTPYLSVMHNPAQRWYYFSDMTPDEMIVFKAWDNNPAAPIGCAHGAFRAPEVPEGTIPRLSAELRFIVFFDN